MTQSQRRKRTRNDLRIAERKQNVVQLPSFTREMWKPHRYKVLWGGRGGARSWSIARILLLKASQQTLRILCAREIQSSIKDSVHQLLTDQIALMELTGYTITEREIRHTNGSFFIFAGLRNQISKIKSFEGIDITWVEEAERISKHSWNILIPTIRKHGSEIWISFNPDKEEDATYQRFVVHPPKDCFAKKVSWEDNPWLTQELRDEKDYAYATDPDAADWVWGGNIRKFSEAQILANKYVIREFTIPYDEDGNCTDDSYNGPYHGIDFGFAADPFAGVRLWIKDNCLLVERECYKHHLEIDHTAQQLEDDIPGIGRYTVRGDSSRPDSISYLKRHGIPRCAGAKKGEGSVEDGIAHLRSYLQIVIHPRCVHFKAEAGLYSYKVDEKSGDILPVIVDKHNHLIDAARYALEPMIKPRVRAGFLFAHGTKQPVCKVCESHLPDSGECPHCGSFHDMITGALVDATVPESAVAVVVPIVHDARNGNGVAHQRHDESDPPNTVQSTFNRLRGLNG
jgi:phage terminase large subunit